MEITHNHLEAGMCVTRDDTVNCVGGENPLWDTLEGMLYFIDNTGRQIY